MARRRMRPLESSAKSTTEARRQRWAKGTVRLEWVGRGNVLRPCCFVGPRGTLGRSCRIPRMRGQVVRAPLREAPEAACADPGRVRRGRPGPCWVGKGTRPRRRDGRSPSRRPGGPAPQWWQRRPRRPPVTPQTHPRTDGLDRRGSLVGGRTSGAWLLPGM